MKKNKQPERENFCIKTLGLTSDEKKELAAGLTDFVAEKKAEFLDQRQEDEE